MTASSISSFLEQVSVRLEVLRECERRFSRELAPYFNPLDLFRVDELALSRCLAHLLDPFGSHGQGDLFLHAFCELLDMGNIPTPGWDTKVRLEDPTDDGRRLDIVIDSGEFMIGIENKPWAGYQERQLEDYADHLAESSGERYWFLVCLDNKEPASLNIVRSILKDHEPRGSFVHLTYDAVLDWLLGSAAFCRALKVRVYVEELAAYIKKEVNGSLDMTQEREVEPIISESESNLEAAFAVAKCLPSYKRKLLESLLAQLRKELGEEGLQLGEREDGFLRQSAEYGFNVCSGNRQAFTLRFTFERAGLNGFYWGITTFQERIPSKHKEAASDIYDVMNAKFHGGPANVWWAWWSYADTNAFSSELADWSSSAKPWIKIEDGSLAKQIARLAKEVYDQFIGKEHLLLGAKAEHI